MIPWGTSIREQTPTATQTTQAKTRRTPALTTMLFEIEAAAEFQISSKYSRILLSANKSNKLN